MKISIEELNERQKWTLEQKIDHSLGAIEQFYKSTSGKCVVSFSGGKDSTVLLHLVRFRYPNIKAVFVNTTNEFVEILRFVKTIENVDTIRPKVTFSDTVSKFGFPLISKKVAKAIDVLKRPTEKNKNIRHLLLTGITSDGRTAKSWKLAKKWIMLVNQKFDITHKCCDELKHKPINIYQKENDVFYFVGTMAENSKIRENNYLNYGCNILAGKNKSSRPLSIWTDNDIWEYIKKYNVPYCDIYDKGEKNTGCAYCGFGCHLEKESRFERLRLREPKRYEQMMAMTNNGIRYDEAINIALKKQPCGGEIIF